MERFDRRYANNLQGLMSSSLAEMGGGVDAGPGNDHPQAPLRGSNHRHESTMDMRLESEQRAARVDELELRQSVREEHARRRYRQGNLKEQRDILNESKRLAYDMQSGLQQEARLKKKVRELEGELSVARRHDPHQHSPPSVASNAAPPPSRRQCPEDTGAMPADADFSVWSNPHTSAAALHDAELLAKKRSVHFAESMPSSASLAPSNHAPSHAQSSHDSFKESNDHPAADPPSHANAVDGSMATEQTLPVDWTNTSLAEEAAVTRDVTQPADTHIANVSLDACRPSAHPTPLSPATPGRSAEELLMSDLDETNDEWLHSKVAAAQFNTPIKPGDQHSLRSQRATPTAFSPPRNPTFEHDPPEVSHSSGAPARAISPPNRSNHMGKVAEERDALLRRRANLIAALTAHKALLQDRHRSDRVYHRLIEEVTSEELSSARSGDTVALAEVRERLEREALARSQAHGRLEAERARLMDDYGRFKAHVGHLLELESFAGALHSAHRSYEIPLSLLDFDHVAQNPPTSPAREWEHRAANASHQRSNGRHTTPQPARSSLQGHRSASTAPVEATHGSLLASARKIRGEVDGLCDSMAASIRSPSPRGRAPEGLSAQASPPWRDRPRSTSDNALARTAQRLHLAVDAVCDKVVKNLAASRSPSPSPAPTPRSILRKREGRTPRLDSEKGVLIVEPERGVVHTDVAYRASVTTTQTLPNNNVDHSLSAEPHDTATHPPVPCSRGPLAWQQPPPPRPVAQDSGAGNDTTVLNTVTSSQEGRDLHMSDLGAYRHTATTTAGPPTEGATNPPRVHWGTTSARSASSRGQDIDTVLDAAMQSVNQLKEKAARMKQALDADNFSDSQE